MFKLSLFYLYNATFSCLNKLLLLLTSSKVDATLDNPILGTQLDSKVKDKPKILNICTNPNCKYCPYIDKCGSIECNYNGQRYFCKENVTCQSSNLIYGIGSQTKRPLYMRLQEHLRSITNCHQNKTSAQKTQPVGMHFSAPDHKGVRDLKIQILLTSLLTFHVSLNFTTSGVGGR